MTNATTNKYAANTTLRGLFGAKTLLQFFWIYGRLLYIFFLQILFA